jgi:DNA-directed RNA polymerase subunit omega
MARITIEDCMEHVPNRFHLVRMASIRAKQLKKGALPLLTSEDNKVVVMSLREIAAGLVKPGEAGPTGDYVDPVADKIEVSDASEAPQPIPTEDIAPPVESDEPTPASDS